MLFFKFRVCLLSFGLVLILFRNMRVFSSIARMVMMLIVIIFSFALIAHLHLDWRRNAPHNGCLLLIFPLLLFHHFPSLFSQFHPSTPMPVVPSGIRLPIGVHIDISICVSI